MSAARSRDRQSRGRIGNYLLLLGSGGIWGVPNGDVRRVRRVRDGYEIRVGSRDHQLAAEEVLGVADLEVWPPPSTLTRFWSEAFGGIAVHGGAPIVILDPQAPPEFLLTEGVGPTGPEQHGEESSHDDGRE